MSSELTLDGTEMLGRIEPRSGSDPPGRIEPRSGSEPPGRIEPRSGTVMPPGSVSCDDEPAVASFADGVVVFVAVAVLEVESSSPQATRPMARTAGRATSRARFMAGLLVFTRRWR